MYTWVIQSSTGKAADVVVGTPQAPMVEAITDLTGFESAHLTMVDDRLYTDIALGKTGIQTVLVLSGETNWDDLPNAPWHPDLVCEDLSELLQILREERQ